MKAVNEVCLNCLLHVITKYSVTNWFSGHDKTLLLSHMPRLANEG